LWRPAFAKAFGRDVPAKLFVLHDDVIE